MRKNSDPPPERGPDQRDIVATENLTLGKDGPLGMQIRGETPLIGTPVILNSNDFPRVLRRKETQERQ